MEWDNIIITNKMNNVILIHKLTITPRSSTEEMIRSRIIRIGAGSSRFCISGCIKTAQPITTIWISSRTWLPAISFRITDGCSTELIWCRSRWRRDGRGRITRIIARNICKTILAFRTFCLLGTWNATCVGRITPSLIMIEVKRFYILVRLTLFTSYEHGVITI